MTSASVGFQCPECVKANNQTVVKGVQTNSFRTMASGANEYVTMALVGANVLVALAVFATGGDLFGSRRAVTGINRVCRIPAGDLLNDGALNGCAVADLDQWWRIVTSGFLHAGLMHLGFNMFILWTLGQQLESAMGRARFGALYGGSLLAGSMGALVVEPDALTVGASGAVFGLMGAAVMASRAANINPFKSGIGSLLAINVVITFAIPGISKGGHIGGLVGGLILGAIFFELPKRVPAIAEHVQLILAGLLSAGFVAGALWAATTWSSPIF